MSFLGLAQAYAASYSGLGKLYRLNFIASTATGALQLEAMRLAVDELRRVGLLLPDCCLIVCWLCTAPVSKSCC